MDASVFFKAKDLKNRIVFSLLALLVFRFGSYITIPGINTVALNEIAQANSSGILGMFNMLSGGSLSRMSIFSLAIFPYITASIVMQLLSSTFKPLEEMKKEGGAGRKKINQYTRYLTVFLCAFQAYAMAISLEKLESSGMSVVIIPGVFFKVSTVTTLVVGTMFLMWLGEQITARGIGNGISLIIFAGIVAGLPQAFITVFELVKNGAMSPVTLLLLFAAILGLIYFIVAVERAQRRIPVQYPKRQKGNKIFGGENTHLPLKLNTAGVIPAIFANSILLFPLTITNFVSAKEDSIMETILIYLGRGKPLYLALYVVFIVFFCFFYTAVVFNVNETADMLKRNGGFLHGRRPGANTAEYLDHVLTRLTVIGASYIAFICVVPEYLSSKYGIPFSLGGTSFLIVVNVVMDTFTQVQSSLFSYQYEGLIKKSKLRRS
ncbi:MAG: preprotein translocase subunit SecY [Alphaproteobacteria bacterium]|nr:preprotein translocase subunit SecY [Alphaproteobacteria bacterium]